MFIEPFTKYNQPIPSELLEARERAIAIEKKKKPQTDNQDGAENKE